MVSRRHTWRENNTEYSLGHRSLEIFSIIGFTILCGYIIYINVGMILSLSPLTVSLVFVGSSFLAYLLADFISGLVHFMCDNLGSENTPLVGKSFIKPFREHHDDPSEMTKHDFVETNGNTFLTCFIGLFITSWAITGRAGADWLFFSNFMIMLGLLIGLTNQFHKWAHQKTVPDWVKKLQNSGIILNPKDHGIHHKPPHNSYYCITSGILNTLLNRIGFFKWLLKVLTKG